MKLTLAILSFYLCTYAIELGNNASAFWWFLAGLAFMAMVVFGDHPKDPPSFS
jgi:hypothetical protein